MKKKSLALAAIAVLMVGSLATAFTLAYFTDTADATNTFTVGNVDISLAEPAWTDGENPGNEMTANPGVAIPKDPTVTNDGDNAAYVRVKVTLDNANAFIAAANKYHITNLATIFAGHDESKWDRAAIIQPTATSDTLTYVYNYEGPLAPDASTGPIFTSFTLPSQFGNADVGATFNIKVVAEAIQVESFADAAAAFTALDAELAPVPAP